MACPKGIGATIGYTGGTDTIANVYSMTPPAPEVADIEVTTYSSVNNYREYCSGLIEPGEMELGCIFTAAAYEMFLDDLGTEYSWTITLSDGSTLVFDAYVKSPTIEHPEADADEVVRVTVTMKVTGPVTFTAAE
jgi:hypothetical protein